MITQIKKDNFEIYTNQIVHLEEFKRLYFHEKIKTTFKTQINNVQDRAFATFLAEERHNTKIKEGDFIIFRAIKGNKKFEFISQIGKWGKFHILKEVIDILKIDNHEKINFEVVDFATPKNDNQVDSIDLSKIKEGTRAIFRTNDFITIVKKRMTPLTLPRFIKLTPDLIELCFLIHGDGHYKTKLFFVNKDMGLHRFVLDKFEQILRIPKETWRARLLYNHPADRELAKKKWKKDLELKDEQFYPTISKCVLKTSNNGNLRLVIDKLIISKVFRFIFDYFKEPKGKNSIYALNGLLYAEGSPEIGTSGLHKITLSFSQNEKEMFSKILSEAGLFKIVKDRKDRFVFEGWHNQCTFFKIFFLNRIVPFDLHESRCREALSGFLNHEFTRTIESYLTILSKKDYMDTNELIKETGYLGNSVRRLLKNRKYMGFINVKGKGTNRNPLMFSITREGKDLLEMIKTIKEVYNERCRLEQDQSRQIVI
jgi:DNA-binding MarR family transcriptional regulator